MDRCTRGSAVPKEQLCLRVCTGRSLSVSDGLTRAQQQQYVMSRSAPLRKGKPQVGRTLMTPKQQEKELKLLESLQDAETRQLESFIKSRNRELDADIKTLRVKLGTGSGSLENDSLKDKVASIDMGVRGVGMGRVEFDTSSFLDNVTKIQTSSGTVPLSLDPTRSKAQSTVRDHLVILLAKIKLSKQQNRRVLVF